MSRSARSIRSFLVLGLAAVSLGFAASRVFSEGGVTYPQGWRQWTHVKSLAITGEEHPLFGAFAGLHHVYVNRAGLAAAREGRAYPDGSVLVFDLLVADAGGGTLAEGDRKFIGVMHKDRRRFAATGGWGFEAFAAGDPGRRVVKDAVSECFGCHQSEKANDYVFSKWRP